MKYKIESVVIASKDVKDVILPGTDLKKPIAVYDPVEIPDGAVGIQITEELLAILNKFEQTQLTGIPKYDEQFMRKHTKGVMRITYLIPEKVQVVK